LKQRREEATSAVNSTFGGGGGAGGASALWPLTRVAARGGEKASEKVTVGGLAFVSLVSPEPSEAAAAAEDGEAAAAALLGRVEASKADVAVVLLVVGFGQAAGAHRALDAWVDPEHLPARHVVEQGAKEARAQLCAVVRAR
jgi:hypothetical protein